jgi:hypothetical protein
MKTDSFCAIHVGGQLLLSGSLCFSSVDVCPKCMRRVKESEVDIWVSSDGRFQLKEGRNSERQAGRQAGRQATLAHLSCTELVTDPLDHSQTVPSLSQHTRAP